MNQIAVITFLLGLSHEIKKMSSPINNPLNNSSKETEAPVSTSKASAFTRMMPAKAKEESSHSNCIRCADSNNVAAGIPIQKVVKRRMKQTKGLGRNWRNKAKLSLREEPKENEKEKEKEEAGKK